MILRKPFTASNCLNANTIRQKLVNSYIVSFLCQNDGWRLGNPYLVPSLHYDMGKFFCSPCNWVCPAESSHARTSQWYLTFSPAECRFGGHSNVKGLDSIASLLTLVHQRVFPCTNRCFALCWYTIGHSPVPIVNHSRNCTPYSLFLYQPGIWFVGFKVSKRQKISCHRFGKDFWGWISFGRRSVPVAHDWWEKRYRQKRLPKVTQVII